MRPEDKLWVLQEAAKPRGFQPHAKGTVQFLESLEREGLLRKSETVRAWLITLHGREELAKLEAELAREVK